MRNAGVLVLLSFVVVGLMAPAAQAKHSGSGSFAKATKTAKTATFVARSNSGEQGGNLQVRAQIKHAARGGTFTAAAVVHCASGPVGMDVTVTYNGTHTTVQATGKVVAADEDEDEEEDEDEAEPDD